MSTVSIAVAMLLGTATAAAQNVASPAPAPAPAPAEASSEASGLEEIVVTGFRRSLEASLDIKRDAIGSVDAIVAEDIAKFPDLNLAESIQRIPGVSIARDAGEGRQVTVRGLGPQFTRVRVNGMEAMSANGGTDAAGGTNRDRSFDFNTFASELFNAITIRKTASADVEEGSLGATVDLRAARPFDYQGFTFVSSLQGSYNDIEDKLDPRAALLLSDRFMDGKLGALISAAYTGRKLIDEGSSTVRWQNAQAANNTITASNGFGSSTAPGVTVAQLNTAYRPRIPRYDHYEHDQDRLGITSSVQWQATDATLLSVDAMYAKFKAQRDEQFLEAPVFSTGGASAIQQVAVRDAQIDQNGALVYGVFDNVDIRSEARHDRLETQFTHITTDLTHDLNDRWHLHGLVGYSEANHQNPEQTTLLFDKQNINGYVYDYRSDNRMPLISYGTTNVADPATWTLTQIRLRPQSSLNTFRTASFDVKWDTTDSLSLKAGPQYKKFSFKTSSLQRSNGTTASQEGIIPATAGFTASNVSGISTTQTFSSLDMPAGSAKTWVIPNLAAANALFDFSDRSRFPLGIEPALSNNFMIDEKDTGGYVQADMTTDLGGHKLRGSLGVRYVRTDQESSGYTFLAGAPVLSTVEHKYNDTLPSLNLAYNVTDDFVMRFAAAKVMARPNGSGQTGGLGILAPGATISIAGNNKTVNTGNPNLDPYRANTLDLAGEWYYGRGGLLSVALFYKDIKSLVQVIRQTGDFSTNPAGLPNNLAITACGTAIPDPTACLSGWQFNLPVNSKGGDLKGLEINYQQPFSFLPPGWDNFGALLNYTYVDSNVDYLVSATSTATITTDLIGLSKNAFNATLYFDNNVFSVRVSAAYRDKYLTTVPGRNLIIPTVAPGSTDPVLPISDRFVEGTNSTLNVDLSSSYKLNDNLEFTFEALNLTDEYQEQYVDGVANLDSYYHHQGRQYLLGARFKF
jgi:TonB-dependent receptor